MSFRGHRGYISALDLSDGTLFTLGMLCMMRGSRRPAVLCIEEPETGCIPPTALALRSPAGVGISIRRRDADSSIPIDPFALSRGFLRRDAGMRPGV